MWQIKKFRTRKALSAWVARNEGRIQWREVFVDSAWAVEWRPLRRIG